MYELADGRPDLAFFVEPSPFRTNASARQGLLHHASEVCLKSGLRWHEVRNIQDHLVPTAQAEQAGMHIGRARVCDYLERASLETAYRSRDVENQRTRLKLRHLVNLCPQARVRHDPKLPEPCVDRQSSRGAGDGPITR